MTSNAFYKLERSKRRYFGTIRYIELIKQSGKIKRLTRSQINALKYRLGRCLATIRKYLKLAALATGICAIHTTDLDAQCRMNRLPISTQSSFQTFIGHASSPAMADIDMDGDYDLVAGHKFGKIVLYENEANFFRPAEGLSNPFDGLGVYLDASPAFVDIDGDGDLDVFVGDFYMGISYFRNENGAFTEVTGTDNPFDGIAEFELASPAFIDIDNDDDPDAFFGAVDGKVHYFENENGSFVEVSGSGNPLNNFNVGSGVACKPSFVDLDQDGDPDAFIGIGDGKIQYYRNDNSSFVEVTGSGNPFNNIDVGDQAAPTFADIDGDGDQDAFIGNLAGDINFFRNVNNSFFRQNSNTILGDTKVGRNAAPAFADLDEDGDEEAVIGQDDGTIRTFINNDGTFSELIGSSNPFDGFDVGAYAQPVLIDLDPTDSDMDMDLFVGAQDGTIHYFRNNNGVFSEISGSDNPFNNINVGGHAAPAFVDFDADNDKDAFVGTNDGTIKYLRNDSGSFTEVIGPGNPFNGIDAGHRATPTVYRAAAATVYVGINNGTIKEYRKNGTSYELVEDSHFVGVDVSSFITPAIVDILPEIQGFEVVIGNSHGGLFVFRDHGGKSNVWDGPFTSHWHGPSSNWDLMAIPKSGCDNVHVFNNSILQVDPSQTAEGRTLTIRKGGQFEVSLGAELIIDPD